ncbi:MAG: glycosyltransferase involved in cell wall biosynthesis [Acidimicrobiales bacterium]|jgi:glycosyltransferase involved in cell wall biosynthesis
MPQDPPVVGEAVKRLGARAKRRLKRGADQLTPAVSAARSHPRAQTVRRDVERLRMRARSRTIGADALLDEIVAKANESLLPSPEASLPPLASLPPQASLPSQASLPRVAVVAPRSVPFVAGGAERHWSSLVAGLTAAGYDTELVSIDSPEASLTQVLSSYQRYLDLDLGDFDVVISGKYPTWMVQHARHIRHLNHPLRGLYDRYPAHLDLPAAELLEEVDRVLKGGPSQLISWALARSDDEPFPGPFARAVVHALDAYAAKNVTVHAAVSEHVSRRTGYIPTTATVAVIPPLTDLDPTIAPAQTSTARASTVPSSAPRGHFLVFGRQTPIKRTELAMRAFARLSSKHAARSGLELRIAGSGPEHDRLCDIARDIDGITMLGHCSDDDLAAQLASCLAVVAVPEDEDFGLVAAEAFAAGRPVITTTDSGGVAEQVEHQVTGLVTAPFAGALSRAMDQLATSPGLADRLGRAGRDQVHQRSWAPMVRLIEHLNPTVDGGARRKLLMLSTFPAEPVRGGGARRLRSVAASLQADHYDVTILTLTNRIPPAAVHRRLLDDGVRQVAVGRSAAHLKADAEMAALVGLPVDDIGCSMLHPSTPEWADTLALELESVSTVVHAHPFLATSLPDSYQSVVVYDAHNVEADLKTELLADRPGHGRLREWTRTAENEAVRRATVVSATSAADAERLHQLYGGSQPRVVVANGVGQHLIHPASDVERRRARQQMLTDLGLDHDDQRPVVLFVASNHPPNHEAADRIATMAAEHPELIVVLAGAHSERTRPNVHNLGRFLDASQRRLLLSADVALNTVAAGSGTNLKLIEALAVGTPVVSSRTGARGLNDPAAHVTLVDDTASASQLAAAIMTTLDAPTAQKRADAGCRLAAAHSWELAIGPLKAALNLLLPVP